MRSECVCPLLRGMQINGGGISMKIITFEDIRELEISPRTCFEWVRACMEKKKDAVLPAKISMRPEEGVFYNVMPCIPDGAWGGVKVITRYPERKPCMDSRLLLTDIKTGRFLALMDGNWITAMRTGAVAAHSVLLFSRKGFSNIGIIGTGNTAGATLLVLAEMETDREFHVRLLRHRGQEEVFARRFEKYKNLSFTYVEHVEQLIQQSEVVISAATFLNQDVCPDRYFGEGVLVVPIHTRGFQNCDLFFDRVFADDYGHVCHFDHFRQFRYFAETVDVVNGTAAGRENDRERILVYNIGIAMYDICFAARIYRMLEENAGLQNANMREPHEGFWI